MIKLLAVTLLVVAFCTVDARHRVHSKKVELGSVNLPVVPGTAIGVQCTLLKVQLSPTGDVFSGAIYRKGVRIPVTIKNRVPVTIKAPANGDLTFLIDAARSLLTVSSSDDLLSCEYKLA
jgi:hypothetical protein